MPAIHHLTLNVTDFERSYPFYQTMLEWLGFRLLGVWGTSAGFDKEGTLLFIEEAASDQEYVHEAVGFHHLALDVPAREDVDRFYEDVLLNLEGVQIEDPPVDCPEYGEGYYATYFFDPDGLKLEVTYTPG